MTQSSKKKGVTSKTTDDDHSDAGCVEEVADAPSIDPLILTLPAVSEREELVLVGPLTVANKSVSRLPNATSRRPAEIVINLRTLGSTDITDLSAIRAMFEVLPSNAAETSAAPAR